MTAGFRLAELASRVEGVVEGDAQRLIRSINTLDAAGAEDLSFLTHPRYRDQARASRAGALLVARGVEVAGKDLLVVDDPSHRLTELVPLFFPPHERHAGVHPTAILEPGCVLDPSVHVGPHAVIGAGSQLGAGCVIHAAVVIGRGCRLGAGVVLFPQVVLYDRTELGDHVVVHAGAVLGSDGFGYATRRGVHHKVPQVGRVVVEAEVEIGANTTIDRATFGETRIGAGSKLDNLVQVGHNVRLGRSCILCAQSGIAGSSELGDGVVLAGQSGVADHVKVGSGVQVAAKSAALQSLEPGQKVAGIPAVPIRQWQRRLVRIEGLDQLSRRLTALERAIGKGAEED